MHACICLLYSPSSHVCVDAYAWTAGTRGRGCSKGACIVARGHALWQGGMHCGKGHALCMKVERQERMRSIACDLCLSMVWIDSERDAIMRFRRECLHACMSRWSKGVRMPACIPLTGCIRSS
eukprot:353069-Chlamydomonas_euryale.AAC.14